MSETASTSSRPASPTHTVAPPLPGAQPSQPYRFQWDAATAAGSRRAGPGSVMSEAQTEARDYFISSNPQYMQQSVSLDGSSIAALPQEWSSSRHGFHAISTVLNNPHKKQAPPKAHSHLPTVPTADLPRVKRRDFDGYLNSIGPEWDRFQKSSRLGREGAADLSGLSSSAGASSSFSLGNNNGSSVPATPTTPSTPLPPVKETLPSLDTVPAVFFERNFDLGNPRTFALVTDPSSSSSSFSSLGSSSTPGSFAASLGSDSSDLTPTSLAHAGPLLDHLSHYADTIEQHLVLEIQARSSSFFAALTNLHDLRSESAQCLSRTQNLRAQLSAIGEGGARPGLEAVRREVKVGNVRRVKEGVGVVERTVGMTGEARGLVEAGEWSRALGMVERMEGMWEHGETAENEGDGIDPVPRKGIALSSLKAFSALPDHLRALTLEIASSLTLELVSTLQSDWGERAQPRAEDEPWDDTIAREALRPLVDGLIRTKSVMPALEKWRESVTGMVKSLIRSHLSDIELATEDFNLDDPQLAAALQTMEHSEFMDLLSLTYVGLIQSVEGLQAQNVLLVELFESSSHPLAEGIDLPSIQDELSHILVSFAELSNASAAKLITVRSDQHASASLPLASFVQIFDASTSFVVRCEVACRRMIVGLRGAIVSQAKAFLQAFHQERLSRAAKMVEDELWNPVDVPHEVQWAVDMLVECAMRDPVELMSKPAAANGLEASPNSDATKTTNGTNGDEEKTADAAPSKHLKIEDRSYFVVGATLQTLLLLSDYARLVLALDTLTTDTMARCIEFLKAFNSRTCQVVLGAGAMRSAGLKNITAKHLALASQSLSVVITLVPYVREMFRRHLSAKQAVMLVEFDKLKRDYQEHQDEIHSKLIAIMGERLTAHLRSLQAVNWEIPGAKPVNDYMELLVKETVTLHKVLSRYLPLPTVEYVMSQVFASITHRLSEAYDPIDLHSLEAKSRLLADARYLHEKLSNLKGVRMPSNMLEVVVSEKPVFIPGAAPPSPALSPALAPPIGQGLSGLGPPGSPGRASDRQSPLHSPSLSPSPLLVRAPSFQQVPVTPPASTQAHSNIHSSAPGTTANARIKGMFARAAKFHTATAAFADLKRAPSPNPSPNSNDRSTPPMEKPLPLPLPEDANGYEQRSSMDGRTSPAPPPKRTMSGFRQVEVVDDAFANGGS